MKKDNRTELEIAQDKAEDLLLDFENLLNEYEPGSVLYNRYSFCAENVREILGKLDSKNDTTVE